MGTDQLEKSGDLRVKQCSVQTVLVSYNSSVSGNVLDTTR